MSVANRSSPTHNHVSRTRFCFASVLASGDCENARKGVSLSRSQKSEERLVRRTPHDVPRADTFHELLSCLEASI